MFKITEFTEAHVASVTNRVEKHGDDEKPAVSIGLELTVANKLLDIIDPALRQALWKPKPDEEPELPGVEVSTPILRCNSIERVVLPTKHEGWTLAVDDGIDDTKPMLFGGTKVDKFSVEPMQGGSAVLRLRCGSSDIDAEKIGKLAMHNGQSIWITLTPPEKPAEAIDGTKGHPGADSGAADATDLFASGGDPDSDEDEDSEGGATDLEERLDNALARADAPSEPDRGENWPFPQKGEGADAAPPQRTTDEAPALVDRPSTKRTARGRERMKAELAKGQAEHDAATQS